MRVQKAIREFDLDAYVRNNFDAIVESSGGTELRVNCFSPRGCNGSDNKQHLWVNTEKRVWICYKCGYGDNKQQQGTGRIVQFIADNEGISVGQVLKRLGEQTSLTPAEELGDLLSDLFKEKKKPRSWVDTAIEFPASFVPYIEDAYSKDRGLTGTMIREHNVLWCKNEKLYKWHGRVIFPIYTADGILISAVGRDVRGHKLRWRNWPNSDLQQCLWPLGRWVSAGGQEPKWVPNDTFLTGTQLVLVEGIFDVIGVAKSEYMAACTFGHKISDRQIATIQKLGVEEVVLAWDHDSQARMINAANRLVGRVPRVSVFPFHHWPADKDFGDIVGNKSLNDKFVTEMVNRIPVESSEFLRWAAKAKMEKKR